MDSTEVKSAKKYKEVLREIRKNIRKQQNNEWIYRYFSQSWRCMA